MVRASATSIEPGTVFGKLTVVEPGTPRQNKCGWNESTSKCVCQCGTVGEFINSDMRSGNTGSCGCTKRPVQIQPGTVFGKLTAVRAGERLPLKDGYTQATTYCTCSCGGSRTVRNTKLRCGDISSCGCQVKDRGGESGKPEYCAWIGMISRCHNPLDPRYRNYGGRGIAVCDQWRDSYEAFLAHVQRRPSSEYSIDRIDNDKGYEPGNVKWSTTREQNNNKRSNRLISFNNLTLTQAQWSAMLGIKVVTLSARLRRFHWSVADALTTPPDYRNRLLHKGPLRDGQGR